MPRHDRYSWDSRNNLQESSSDRASSDYLPEFLLAQKASDRHKSGRLSGAVSGHPLDAGIMRRETQVAREYAIRMGGGSTAEFERTLS